MYVGTCHSNHKHISIDIVSHKQLLTIKTYLLQCPSVNIIKINACNLVNQIDVIRMYKPQHVVTDNLTLTHMQTFSQFWFIKVLELPVKYLNYS